LIGVDVDRREGFCRTRADALSCIANCALFLVVCDT
jgi:hypothetical protein